MRESEYYERNSQNFRGFKFAQNDCDILWKTEYASNSTVIIYTVPTNKIFYIDYYQIYVYNNSGVFAGAALFIRDTSDVATIGIANIALLDQNTYNHALSLFKPFIAPQGYDICISSTNAGLATRANIQGELFDV